MILVAGVNFCYSILYVTVIRRYETPKKYKQKSSFLSKFITHIAFFSHKLFLFIFFLWWIVFDTNIVVIHEINYILYNTILEWPSKSKIKNSIEPHCDQHILRHFIIIWQCKNYVNLKHCIGQKLIVNVIRTAHSRINFLKTLI